MTDKQILKAAKARGETQVNVDGGCYCLMWGDWASPRCVAPRLIWVFVPTK